MTRTATLPPDAESTVSSVAAPTQAASASDAAFGPLGTVLQATHEAIVMVDETQTIMAFNPAAQALFACTGEQALGRSLSQFIPAADRELHADHVRSFARSNELQREMAPRRLVKALRADGREVPVEVTLSRVDTVVAGVVQHWFAALLRDTSAEHALRRELDIATQRWYAALDTTPMAIVIADDHRILYANRAAARLAGTPDVQALVGQQLPAILPASTLQGLRAALSREGQESETAAPIRVPGQLVRSDGQVRDVEIMLVTLPDHGDALVQLVIDDVTDRRRVAAASDRAGAALRRLQASVVEAREEERRRISRELHDELGQRLTALKMDVSALARKSGLSADDAHVQGMQTMLDETVASVRRIASDLRPLMLDDLGLNAAIEWLAREMGRRTGIDIQVALDEERAAPTDRIATVLYRAVQEALTNVMRHANASHVAIGLHVDQGQWVLTVQDDGVGLPKTPDTREDAYGLMGIRERAAMMGGLLTIESVEPQGGTRLTMRLPITVSRDPQ